MESKKWFLSKTLWLQLLGVVAIIVPQSSAFIAEHFSVAAPAWMFINVVLRLITKDKLEIT
jgi:hypothetical protein